MTATIEHHGFHDKGADIVVMRMTSECDPRPPAGLVTHDYSALVYHLGEPTQLVSPTPFTVCAGDVCIIPAGAPHRHADARGTRIGVGFCRGCLGLDSPRLWLPFDRVRAGATPVVTIPEDRRPRFETFLDELLVATTRDIPNTLVSKSLLVVILDEVQRATTLLEPLEGSLVSDALHFIERRCLTPISLSDVAAAVHRSPAHVTTTLRKATGRTVNEWILAHRMSEARRRLRHTDELVDVIAERVGFSDTTHFIRSFRRLHGQTPAAFRKSTPERTT